uniref:Hypothetical secreted protein n=1 Tax=Simulium nigrimanum TaxID=683695 RepID=D1FPX7_SIMNI
MNLLSISHLFLLIQLLQGIAGGLAATSSRPKNQIPRPSIGDYVEPNTKHPANYRPPTNQQDDGLYQKPITPELSPELLEKIKKANKSRKGSQ